MRIDAAIFARGLSRSRTHAQNLISLGCVLVNGSLVDKAAVDVSESDVITLCGDFDFESLGGIKLKATMSQFAINVNGLSAVDIGCSNGGFSAVLLDAGVSSLVAVDVGECALPQSVLSSPKIRFLRANARNLTPSDIDGAVDFAVTDVSFISLTLILPTIYNVLKEGGRAVALVKPQFELGRSALTKRGIVKSVKLAERCVSDILSFASGLGFKILGSMPAPHPFEDKNQEYLIYIIK